MSSRIAADPFRAGGLYSDGQRVEVPLATARAFVALSVVAAYWTPVSSVSAVALASVVLWIYAVYSLVLVVVVNVRDRITTNFSIAAHSVDVLVSASLLANQPDSPFLSFFVLFPLLTAAYRWGLPQTLTTAGATLVIGFSGAAFHVVASEGWESAAGATPDLDRLGAVGAFISVVAVLLGYLAEKEHQRRAEAAIVSRIVEKPHVEAGLTWTLRGVADEILAFADAKRAVLVARETASGRVVRWDVRRGFGRETTLRMTELDPTQEKSYLVVSRASAWHTTRRTRSRPVGSSADYDVVAIDRMGKRVRVPGCPAANGFFASETWNSVIAISFDFAGEWSGRLFLLDPTVADRTEQLRLLQRVVCAVSPVIYNVYLLRRVRSRAKAIERARLARELHDGVIQSLIGAEMQVHALRRQLSAPASVAENELSRIQAILHDEVLKLRELMERSKPLSIEPAELPGILRDTMNRFTRDTNIQVTFVSELKDVVLAPRTCGEIARIVQEALANVRKHSGARTATVRFIGQGSQWTLAIEDDGRGFGFSGRVAERDLAATDAASPGSAAARQRGLTYACAVGAERPPSLDPANAPHDRLPLWRMPAVIRESVRSIAGHLVIESYPGRGTRVEVTSASASRVGTPVGPTTASAQSRAARLETRNKARQLALSCQSTPPTGHFSH